MKRLVFFLAMIVCCMSVMTGCDFFGTSNDPLIISGYVYLDSTEPLSDVSIKSETIIYDKTDENGYFSISVNKSSVELFAEKSGYAFSPHSVTISENTNNLIFNATKTQDLNGLLTLNHIVITPTSMVSFGDDYSYEHENETCLKIDNLKIDIDNKTFDILQNDLYAVKNKSNIIAFDQDVTVNTDYDFNIWFSLDAYFTSLNQEFVYHEERQSVIRVQEKQTTADLNDNNQIVYTAVGVNSSNNMFTYNISFVFDYYENV